MRTQARDVQRGVRRGEARALELAGTPADPAFRLWDAQRALARFYGFRSWPRLRQHVVAIESRTWSWAAPDAQESAADRLLRLSSVSYDPSATCDPDAAGALLATDPALAATNLATAAVAGDGASVRSLIAAGSLADEAIGPYGWTPLMYLAYSRLDVGEAATLEVARTLLAAGADANDGRYFLGYPTPFTVLTGAFGDGERGQPAHPHSLALARVLLEAGADPNDGQALYNRMFDAGSPGADDFLPLLFAFGLGSGDGGPWHRRLPDLADTPREMLRSLLDWAVTHGQAERVALLGRHGVDVLSAAPDGRTPLAAALANGHRDVADVLRGFGASEPTITAPDAYVGAVLAGDRAAVARTDPGVVAAVRAERPGLIVWAASQGRVVAVELLAEAGFDPDVLARGDVPSEQPWQTALHSAVERDHAEIVGLLLRLGARRDVRDARFDGTPADWARHFDRPHLVALLEDDATGP